MSQNVVTQLNVADQALIVDMIIEASKSSKSEFIKSEYLKLIKKVKSLEIEHIEVNENEFQKILDDGLLKY